MKKFNKIFGIWLIAFLSSISCTKEITLEPVSIISSSSFWKTENDATGALYGMYARFRGVTGGNLLIWGEARSQDMKKGYANDFNNARIFDNSLDLNIYGPDWSSLYQVLNDANLILKNVPNIKFISEDNKNRILAEAHTMRAFCYFLMVRTWGDVILVTEPTEGYDPSKIYKERSSVADVFILIKKDLDDALSLFPDNNFTTGRNRWSKPAANALTGDVYLWTGKVLGGGNADFTIALNALNEIESSDVALLTDFKRVFDYDNKGNKEIIIASNFLQNESGGTSMGSMYFGSMPPNPSPTAAAAIGNVPGGQNYWTLSDETRFKFLDDDQRKDASFIELYTADPATGLYTILYGCIQKKFDGLVDAGSRYFLDDVIIYRYADILLMKAEAENALGQDPSADINKVRERAYGANFSNHVFVNGTKAQNDSLILNERHLELLYEGKRWWDILRFGKASELIPYFRENPGNEYKFLWPITLKTLSLEPKVSQNPGY